MPSITGGFTPSQLQLVLDAPSINVFSCDRDYRYTSFNRKHAQTMQEIWGVCVCAEMDILQDAILNEHDRLKSKVNFDRALAGEELLLVEAFGVGDARRLFEDHYCPMRQKNGEIIGVMVIATDVTERVQLAEERLALERKLLEASQLLGLGMMVGCIAHDFNNLLVPILLSAQVAQGCVDPEHQASNLLATVVDSTKIAAELTKQLLNLLGSGETSDELIDFNMLINSTAELARVSVRRCAELKKQLSEKPLRIHANTTQLRQVITNLLINASEAASGTHPQVTLETSFVCVTGKIDSQVLLPPQVALGDYAVMTVRDNGCGMTSEQLNQIFQPFYSTKGTGRGFGLTAVQGIVRNHNGFLAIDSTPGFGTTFQIGIPLATDSVMANAESLIVASEETAEFPAKPLRILITDSDPGVLKCLSTICTELGHRVVAAKNGIAALVALQTQGFDLILLDAELADVGCTEILAAIPRISMAPVALMSGGVQESMLISNSCVHCVLAKPFSLASLVTLLKRFDPQTNVSAPIRQDPITVG